MGLTRRRLLQGLGFGAAGLLAGRVALPHWQRAPEPKELPPDLAAWVDDVLGDLDRARLWDVHVHVFGTEEGGNGCRVSPHVRNPLRPWSRLQYDVFLAASGVHDLEQADEQYTRRLLALHRLGNPQGRLVLLAFDEAVSSDGTVRPDEVPYSTPDEYVLRLARENPAFEAGVSIHPYRDDAVERLRRAAKQGARLVKWLPATMDIDPASPRCDRFYEALAELRLPLLTHAGSEMAVSAHGRDDLGNPLRLRRPLELGVRVVVAHCASSGTAPDTDAPPGKQDERPCHELFLRLMREPRYERLLLGDVSALTQVNRCGAPLRDVLAAPDLHHRLVNGSDYPLPALDLLISTWLLERRGYLTRQERRQCERVFEHNPLLFDLVVKRCLAVREGGHVHRFAPNVFETAWLFG